MIAIDIGMFTDNGDQLGLHYLLLYQTFDFKVA